MVTKVKCIDSSNAADMITVGNVYKCLEWIGTVVKLLDDNGEVNYLMSKRFEVIEDTPTNILEITW